MAIEFVDENNKLRRISLSGRLDIPGTAEIEMKLTALTATESRRVILDLTTVTFLASIGIRAIITNARALQQRGGKMVLFVGDNTSVSKTLETTGIDTLIPTFKLATEADQAALS